MRRSPQQGVALVITLIMLAVVTVMAIIFLGVSRRERAAVSVTTDFTTARLMADAALARAQGQIVSHVGAHSNLFAYDLMVSTNFINRAGFQQGIADPTNVAYVYPDGSSLNSTDHRLNLVNLWYDPRPPVFVTTNSNPNVPPEFRFYLDINRNGQFETNGWVQVFVNGQPMRVNNEDVYQFMVGDPEWIGMLERPDQPHSPSNLFVGRYAYIMLPAGKSLDLNYIHNSARTDALGASPIPEGYSRNQGVGSWEINLAAFFQSLLPALYSPYVHDPTLGLQSGNAFDDARAVLNYRQARSMGSLQSVSELFGPRGVFAFRYQPFDGYGHGMPAGSGVPRTTIESPDLNFQVFDPNKKWWGSDAIEAYVGVQDLFDRERFAHRPNPEMTNFQDRLVQAGNYWGDTEYRYAYHTLLAQMGVDSLPANEDRIHLNYVNVTNVTDVDVNSGQQYLTNRVVPHLVTNFLPWAIDDPQFGNQRLNFFTNAVDRMLAHLYGATLRDGIQVYPTNNYNGAVHRVLQVAANILDASTNRVDLSDEPYFPTVFRPLFRRSGDTLAIAGYAEVTDADHVFRSTWIDLRSPDPLAGLQDGRLYGVNVHGVPLVIGAKKGWPNFNEFQLQTSVQITRRMEAYKASRTAAPRLHQSYEIGISNVFGIESWNSYTQDFPRALEMRVTNLCQVVLRDEFRAPGAQILINQTITNSQYTNFAPNAWRAEQFQISSRLFEPLPNSEYWPRQTPAFRQLDAGVAFDETTGFPVPDFKLDITNRLTVVMVATDDRGTRRLVDFVNLDGMPAGMDISEHLVGRTNIFADRGLDAGSFWITNRLNDAPLAATYGITNQLYVSTNDVLSRTDWRSLTENPISGQQKEKAIDDFRLFMGLPALFDTRRTQPPPGLRVQVPFSPSRILDQNLSWQANDPLVHYHIEDLYDQQLTDIANVVPRPPGARPPTSNIGRINQRYRPWGGRPGSVGDQWAFNVGVKDPGVRRSDDWVFPTNQFATIGYLGRVHRGTPWQTIYLKSAVEPVESWVKWALRPESHPTNDWAMLELFTTAMNDNAARGLLSANQENRAAWTAVLAGIPVLTNTLESANLTSEPTYDHLYIQPNSPQVEQIVDSINQARAQHHNQTFRHLGHVLSAPALTVESPYLNRQGDQALYGITDAMYEWIPQQILSLLKEDEPYVVVYAYGQALRPAPDSRVTAPGDFFGMVTNYQITSEVLTKTALRLEEVRRPDNQPSLYRSVIKSHNILPAD